MKTVRFNLQTFDGLSEELESIIEELQAAGGTLVTRNPLVFSTDDPERLIAVGEDYGLYGQVESR